MGAGAHLRGQHLVFHLEDRTYCIPTACVEEIVPMAALTAVPCAPTFLAGFLDVAGRLVAVISLRRLMGMPDREPELYTPIVLLKAYGLTIALEVDGVSQIVEIGVEDLIPVSEGCSTNDCATAVARLDGTPVVVLSPERLLLHEERQRVAELAAFVRERVADVETVNV